MKLKNLIIGVSLMALIPNLVRADEVITTVFNVLESQGSSKILILSGADGRIFKAPKSEANLKLFRSYLGKVVKLTYIENSAEATVTNVEVVKPGEVDSNVMDLNYFQARELRKFAPTDLQSPDDVTKIFDNMLNDGDKTISQCYKRAHIWSFDMWSKLSVKSEKIFIFYSRRYAILEKEKWWYHVAPMVTSNGEKYVLDGTFMDRPVTIKEWTSFFMKSDKVSCPVVGTYQQYQSSHWNHLCTLMITPMYYFGPNDIEDRDYHGIRKNHWKLDELQDARRAFKGYTEAYEGLDTGKPLVNGPKRDGYKVTDLKAIGKKDIKGVLVLKGSKKTKVKVNGVTATCKADVQKVENLMEEDSFGNPAYMIRLDVSLSGSDKKRKVEIKYDVKATLTNMFSEGVRDLEYYSAEDKVSLKVEEEESMDAQDTKFYIGYLESVSFKYQNQDVTCNF